MITKLLKMSLATLMITGMGLNAQVTGYDFDAFGFESQNVVWTTATNIYDSPGNIVEAWSQVIGFEQSNEQAYGGSSYSLKVDFTTPIDTPKLQTYRSNTNKEGNFEIGSTGNYIVSVWVYLTNLSSGTLKSTVQESSAGTYNANFDLSEVTQAGTWTQLQDEINITSIGTNSTKFWSTVNFTSIPSATIVYVDDLLVTKGSLSEKGEVLANVSVYPNPVNDILNISAPLNSEITITNIAGVAVKSFTTNSEKTGVSVKGLISGIYIVKVISEGKNFVTKVVIQ